MKELSEFKPILTNILKEINDFCESNNLRYSLAYGTLIGAVRHHGFIPWDDDIDIMMPRPDYEIFRKKFNHPKIKLINGDNSNDYVYPFIKAFDNRTLIIEKSDMPASFGLYIDIFPIDGMPSNKIAQNAYTCYFHFLKELVSIKNMSSLKNRGFSKKILVRLLKVFFSPMSVDAIARWMNKSALICSYTNSSVVGNLMWESYKIRGFRKDMFESYTELDFENFRVKAISEYDSWLRTIYGDYMQLPPIDKRKSNHSFTAYLKNDEFIKEESL